MYPMYETYKPYKPRESKMEPVVPEEWRAVRKPDRPISRSPSAWKGTVGFHHPLVVVADKADSDSTAWRIAGALVIIAGAVTLCCLY